MFGSELMHPLLRAVHPLNADSRSTQLEHPRGGPQLDGPTVAATSSIAARGLGDSGGARLGEFWHRLFGGGVEKDLHCHSPNHIGVRSQNDTFGEGSWISNAMRNTPYLGDYWEALAATHDAANFSGVANGVTAISNVALSGPLLGMIDMPFRMFGKSMVLNNVG